MGHKWSHREIRAAIKASHAEMAEAVPDEKAREAFRAPAYQAGRMVREQSSQIRKTANEGFLGCSVNDDRINEVKWREDAFKCATGHVEERRLSVAEYLAEKFGIGGEERGQN